MLNWSLFLYDPSELDARVNVCVTMFLATAALLYVVSESLPKTDFLTKLDQLILLTLFVQVLATIETWLVALMTREDWGMRKEAEAVDLATCWGIPAIVLMCNLALFGPRRLPVVVVGKGACPRCTDVAGARTWRRSCTGLFSRSDDFKKRTYTLEERTLTRYVTGYLPHDTAPIEL